MKIRLGLVLPFSLALSPWAAHAAGPVEVGAGAKVEADTGDGLEAEADAKTEAEADATRPLLTSSAQNGLI